MIQQILNGANVIGIKSELPSYRLCWLLNNELDVNFVREPSMDICQQTESGEKHYFPLYQYAVPYNGTRYTLYKLKTDNTSLLSEDQQVDYICSIQSSCTKDDVANLKAHIVNMPDVEPVKIKTKDLKNLQRLIA